MLAFGVSPTIEAVPTDAFLSEHLPRRGGSPMSGEFSATLEIAGEADHLGALLGADALS